MLRLSFQHLNVIMIFEQIRLRLNSLLIPPRPSGFREFVLTTKVKRNIPLPTTTSQRLWAMLSKQLW